LISAPKLAIKKHQEMQKDTFLGENHTFPVIKLPPRGEEESEA
jgi:hypothetical protein